MQNILLSLDIKTVISESLDKYLGEIHKAFNDAVDISSKKLGETAFSDSICFICKDSPERCIPEDGASGYTVHAGLVDLYIDSNNVNYNSIYSTVCHEITHAKRFSKLTKYDGRLLAALVFEGIAVAYEDEIRTEKYEETFFLHTIKSRINTEKLISIVKNELLKEDYDYMELFFNGNKSKNIPRWAGYEMGYFIVTRYMKLTNKKASELIYENVDNFKKVL